jgi:tetratricopeptide (TPR) repeat protein
VSDWRWATSLVLVAFALAGCVSRGPLITSSRSIVELEDTPFFAQTQHQCGPAALATVLGASGVMVTPEEISPLVYLPGRRGSLQIEMQAAPRQYARIGYRIEPELDAIVAEVTAGRPVLVLHNYGLPFLPRWHYAVVVGYDGQRDRVLLRSGKVKRQELSAANFMRAWDNADRWGMVLLRAGELPQSPDKDRYLQAAADFERVAAPRDAHATFEAATRQWPGDAVAWIGLGTASYRNGDLKLAAANYRTALRIDNTQIAARNNLAMTLLDLGCARAARMEMASIPASGLAGELAESVADTRKQIEQRSTGRDESSCPVD